MALILLVLLLISQSVSQSQSFFACTPGNETSVCSRDNTLSEAQESEITNFSQDSNSVKWPHFPDALRYLTKKEFQMYKLMKETATEMKERLAEIDGWLKDFEGSSMKGTAHLEHEDEILEEISGHPLMGLRMIRRYSLVKNLVQAEKEDELKSLISNIETSYGRGLPSDSDYDHAMDLVIHLQYSHDLNATDLMNGKIGHTQTAVGLTPVHANELALRAEETGNFTEAVFWLRALLESNQITDEVQSQMELNVDRVAYKHATLLANLTEENYWDNLHRFWTTEENEMDQWPAETLKQKLLTTKGFWTDPKPNQAVTLLRAHLLCSGGHGHEYMPEHKRAKLVCYYESGSNPYWLINPLKIEVHSWDPYIVRIYEVAGDKTVAYSRSISASASNEGNDTELIDNGSGAQRIHVGTFNASRVGTLAFPYNSTGELVRLCKKIGLITGLEVNAEPEALAVGGESVELFRITSYSYGGIVEPHADALPGSFPLIVGDRLATFMIYMNDVRLGGATAFPLIGLAVRPIKGSALFWINLHRNGTEDERTLHGGCPVLLGEKWIANTWIRSAASFLKRPCSLRQDE